MKRAGPRIGSAFSFWNRELASSVSNGSAATRGTGGPDDSCLGLAPCSANVRYRLRFQPVDAKRKSADRNQPCWVAAFLRLFCAAGAGLAVAALRLGWSWRYSRRNTSFRLRPRLDRKYCYADSEKLAHTGPLMRKYLLTDDSRAA